MRNKVEIGDKVLLKGKFFYPYHNWSCDGCIGTIISKHRDKDWGNNFLFTVDVYEVYVNKGLPSVLNKYNMRKMEVKDRNISKILMKGVDIKRKKEKIKLKIREIDPYGEENW